jgi:hypothetical protein
MCHLMDSFTQYVYDRMHDLEDIYVCHKARDIKLQVCAA